MSARSLIRPSVAVICIGLTVLGLRNTYGDNENEKAQAEEMACGKPDCAVRMLSESRSAIGQTFSFQTAKLGRGVSEAEAIVHVECERSLIFVGDYGCEVVPAP